MKYFSIGQQWILLGLALFLLTFLFLRFYHHPSPAPEVNVKEFVVEVSGEVRNPGIYLSQNPPTLREAIEKAGGLKETAKFDVTSSSEILESGTLLIITKESYKISASPLHPSPLPPGEKEKDEGLLLKGGHEGIKHDEIKVKIGRMAANKLLVFSIPLDLNRVSAEDLCLVPGVGESLAQEIVAYREGRRGYRSVGELKNVKGVGEKKWKAIKNFFTVTQP